MKKTGEIVKACLVLKNMCQADLARAVDTSSQRISQKLTVNQDIKFQEFVEFMDGIGLDVCIKDPKTGWTENVKKI